MASETCGWSCNCIECELFRRVELDAIKARIHGGPDAVFLCGASDAEQPDAKVIDLSAVKRKRDEQEERRLEQKVIERWTGKDENDAK